MKETLVILQCCKRKRERELFPDDNYDLAGYVPHSYGILEDSVKRLSTEGKIYISSQPVTALSLYNGHFYTTPCLKTRVASEIRHGPYQFLIMSAGYGLVHPFQKIHNCEQKMIGKITKHWLNVGLPKVLSEFIHTCKFKNVYGFFSKSADYKKIFEATNWNKLKRVKEVGYFYPDGIKGTSRILRVSAMLMLALLNENFVQKPRSYLNANIAFVDMHI